MKKVDALPTKGFYIIGRRRKQNRLSVVGLSLSFFSLSFFSSSLLSGGFFFFIPTRRMIMFLACNRETTKVKSIGLLSLLFERVDD